MVIPSNACNASCHYCFGPNKGRIINEEQFSENISFIEKVVQTTQQTKVHITFHGGEPLMAPLNIWKSGLKLIDRTFKTQKLKLQIQSNLWNLTQEHCALFRDYGISFSTSLDGPEEINDLHRGKGYFSKTMNGVDLLRKNNMKVGSIATFSPKNMDKINEIFTFFVRQRLSFAVHASLPPLTGKANSFVLSPQQYGTLLCDLFDLYVPNRKYISISSFDQLCQSITDNRGKVCTFKDCTGSFLAIDPEGNIYPCQRFSGNPDYCLGNVIDPEIISRLQNNPVTNSLVAHHKQIKIECKDCDHMNYCKGGCYYNSKASKETKDPYCESYKMIFNKIRNRLIGEMSSPDNFREIVDKPFTSNGNPLLRKGPVIELTQKPHPVTKAINSAKIISVVALSRSATIDEAHQSLKDLGIGVEKSYLENLKEQFSRNHFKLNNCYIHTTFNCQLACTHCYAKAGNSSGESMRISQIADILMQVKENKFRQAIITGGEPLICDNLDGFLNRMIELRLQIEPVIIVLRTNLSMPLSDGLLAKIARAFHQIVVSVDGDKEYHEKRRGEGTYSKVTENIQRYQQVIQNVNKPAELSIGCVMPADDIHGGPGQSVRDFAYAKNIRRVRFKPLLPIGRAADTYTSLVSEALDSYVDKEEALKYPFKPFKTCGIGYNVYIEPKGHVFPCYAFHKPHTYIGNVFESGLNGIVMSEAFRTLSEHNVDTNSKCKKCGFRYLCGGACRAWGRNFTQYDLDAPPPDCEGLYKKAEDIYTAALDYLKSR